MKSFSRSVPSSLLASGRSRRPMRRRAGRCRAGNRPAARGVPSIALAVHARQVRLLDQAHVDLEPDHQRDQRRQRHDVRREQRQTERRRPSSRVKIGLRTHRNGPVATSVVRAVASTPTRHESPMANCAQSVAATPTRTAPSPTAGIQRPPNAASSARRTRRAAGRGPATPAPGPRRTARRRAIRPSRRDPVRPTKPVVPVRR